MSTFVSMYSDPYVGTSFSDAIIDISTYNNSHVWNALLELNPLCKLYLHLGLNKQNTFMIWIWRQQIDGYIHDDSSAHICLDMMLTMFPEITMIKWIKI